MTNRELFFKYRKELSGKVEESALRIALAEANGFPGFSELISSFDKECKNQGLLEKYVKGLLEGKPIQYVTGHASFLDLVLNVDESVLIPRPETEQLALLAENMIKSSFSLPVDIVDIGTGSGCLAIFLKKRLPEANVTATDISEGALETARKNAAANGTDIDFLLGDMACPLVERGLMFDILVSNPPYIEREEDIEPIVSGNEPHLALLAKPATKYYETLIKTHGAFMKPNALMLFEIGEDMEPALLEIIRKYVPAATYIFKKDIYGKTRFLLLGIKEI